MTKKLQALISMMVQCSVLEQDTILNALFLNDLYSFNPESSSEMTEKMLTGS